MSFDLIQTIDVANTLGEGVLWGDQNQMIWWTDIEGQTLYQQDWNMLGISGPKTYALPERLCSMGFIDGSDDFICAFASGFARLNPAQLNSASGGITPLIKTDTQRPFVRLNDGRVDRQGRFWVGAMVEGFDHRTDQFADLYCLGLNGELSTHEGGILISNSLSWSPDSRTLYFADSPKNTIYTYDFSPDAGTISNRRTFARTPKGVHPDGSCVDADGYLWNAEWGAGQITRYAPNGEIDTRVKVPCAQPTCVAFGGPNLDHLIVTSANLDMSEAQIHANPNAGALFIFKTPYQGLKEARFKGQGFT